MNELIPPIKERTSKHLLNIAASPEGWREDAVAQALEELKSRNILEVKINQARHSSKQKIELGKAKESYSILDFLYNPLATFFEIVISWELRKDGFERKANQQLWLRPIFLLVIIIAIIYLANN
ncbi:MAG: hypothetical protein EOO93_10650 [Pedobacter sp.]|nr:MAG: hypothetical protein EOO93_10650 [Pedobacter sp.]